jgi:hypothetical protein
MYKSSNTTAQVVVMPLYLKEFYRAAHHVGLGNNATWIRRYQFSYEYYLMGRFASLLCNSTTLALTAALHHLNRWRLTFMYDFVREMGHKFLLQVDDDTFVARKIDFNIVQAFTAKGIGMGMARKAVDVEDVLLGLVEFTRYDN